MAEQARLRQLRYSVKYHGLLMESLANNKQDGIDNLEEGDNYGSISPLVLLVLIANSTGHLHV